MSVPPGPYPFYPYDPSNLPVTDADMQAALNLKQDDAAFLTTLVGIGGTSGSGNLARVTSPTFVTPVLGAATGTSLVVSGTVAANRVGVGNGTVSAPSLYGKDTAGTAGWYWVSNSCIYATSSYAHFGIRGNFVAGNVSTVFCCTSGDANAGIDVSLGRSSSGVWQMGNGTNNANGSLLLTNLAASGTVRFGTYTVATLPSASANTRARAFVSDSNLAFNSTNLGSTVTAGGSTLVPVFSDGTNWVIG